ncbi:hypothetical protein [Cellulomonas wangsupingiae]|uniref:VCBS repeat-containing protein n=1 Tax=Cellulomonas wangsupingiae TaxID=2968085 RepID=A0ABY5K0M3_9CELL|nr:hypothetical protein [Cellulomonas wangsupingiae]MCC2333458.1 hypothetical protein [Cellulomonas wangsupingiae]MCM0638309.1 hypothetical protein [Cellulomonas wangsupingiae]UUI63643.1 hypothetical protein NP075_10835 [Cellulomonas wangsupingiae]
MTSSRRRRLPWGAAALAFALVAGLATADLVGGGSAQAAPAPSAPFPLTGLTTSATQAEIAACSADQSHRTREPNAHLYYFKRGQVWYVVGAGQASPSPNVGAASFCFIFGNEGDIGVIGTWGVNGKTYATPGVFRPSTGEWFFSGTEFGSTAAESRRFGSPGDQPFVGDWDGDGLSDLGVKRGTTWYLQTDRTSTIAQGTRTFGAPEDVPLGGEGSSRIGLPLQLDVYRPSTATFSTFRDVDGQIVPVITGAVGDQPVAPVRILHDSVAQVDAGHGAYRPSTATLRLGTGFGWSSYAIGQAGDQVLRTGVICDLNECGSYPYP